MRGSFVRGPTVSTEKYSVVTPSIRWGLSDIDLFINDSDHSAEYEYKEYLTVADKLTPSAVILGDNSHVSDSLRRFSEMRHRRFLFFQEKPKEHWYPGAGIGISYLGPKAIDEAGQAKSS